MILNDSKHLHRDITSLWDEKHLKVSQNHFLTELILLFLDKKLCPEGCIVVDTIEKALAVSPKNEDVFIIGGGEIYRLGLAFADKIELTRVNASFEADTFFQKLI